MERGVREKPRSRVSFLASRKMRPSLNLRLAASASNLEVAQPHKIHKGSHYVIVQRSWIDQLGHTGGIGLWGGSVRQGGRDANSTDIDGEVDMVG